MEKKEPFRPSSQLLIGLLVIFLGVIFTLGNLDVLHSYEIVRFWPVAVTPFRPLPSVEHAAGSSLLSGGSWVLVDP